MSKLTFFCDLAEATIPLPHFWEHTVGSDHAPMALRADWQRDLKRAHEELGFRYVRFAFTYHATENGKGTFSDRLVGGKRFIVTDGLYDDFVGKFTESILAASAGSPGSRYPCSS